MKTNSAVQNSVTVREKLGELDKYYITNVNGHLKQEPELGRKDINYEKHLPQHSTNKIDYRIRN